MSFNIHELLTNILPFAMIGFVFYFFLLRPQQQKMKKHTDMMASLKAGDKIITTGGIIGVIKSTPSDKELIMEISNGVDILLDKSAITGVSKSTYCHLQNNSSIPKEKKKKKISSKKTQ